MKKMIKDIRILAALLIASATFAACSSDDSILSEQPAQQVYTMTVQVTKTVDGEEATTRGLELDSKTLNITWNENEEVEVFQKTQVTPEVWTSLGKLKAQASSNGTTTLTGGLSTDLKKEHPSTYPLLFILHSGDMDYKEQNGVLDRDDNATKSIEDKYDHAMSNTVSDFTVDGNNVTVSSGVTLNTIQAIVKFTLEDAVTGNPIKATSLKIKGSKYMYESLTPTAGAKFTNELTITPATATDAIYVAIGALENNNFTLTATTEDGKTYTYEKSGATFIVGKYYEIKVKMTKQSVDLATIGGNYIAVNGDVLTGELAGYYKISIADGATVKLKDVTIKGSNIENYDWAGITCEGDATIILEGTNSVQGFYHFQPGISVPSDKTLTIRGSGSLEAKCIQGVDRTGFQYFSGSGIGGRINKNCGNIVIESGTITATGGKGSAGIGSANQHTCGTITIKGGTVTAKGGYSAAGIGSGYSTTCGNISITGGTVIATGGDFAAGIGSGGDSFCSDITLGGTANVTATKGEYSPYCIGVGYNATVGKKTSGTITIGGTVYYNSSTGTWAAGCESKLKANSFTYPEPKHRLSSAAIDDIGKIVGADGYIYGTKADAIAAGTTAAAMVAYVDDSGHGLAIQLNAYPERIGWDDANTYVEDLTEISGGTWRLPSKEDWQNMFVACAVSGDASAGDMMEPINGFGAKIIATGIGWHYGYYWTSNVNGSNAWQVRVDFIWPPDDYLYYYAEFSTLETNLQSNVLGCLAF